MPANQRCADDLDLSPAHAELSPESAAHDPAPRPPLSMRAANLVAILAPLVGFIAAMHYLWGVGFSWTMLALLVGMYGLTAIGITIGYHRYFTHKSFETNVVVKAILGVLGSMAVQGSILEWSATHRSHHQHSDRHDDPHSPNTFGSGVRAMLRGIVHAHFAWLLDRNPRHLRRYVPDLEADPVVRVVSRLFPLWVALGLLLPGAIAWAITGTLTGAFLGFVWGGLARVFLVHHVTWSVNSVCHIWGTQPFRSHDHSRNNPIVGILALGEGWHNNHHAFPASARHGLRWWEVDLSYLIIRTMALVGLARNIRVPSRERMEAKRSRHASRAA
ncbi:MAG: fatty acid desaturase [Phycisphaerales bacterium]|nr:fatty acid desaturase [Phycisphaerales bacterium]